jgi:hypothetical protein
VGRLLVWNSLIAATGRAGGGAAANCSGDTVPDSNGSNLDSDGTCRLAGVGDVSLFDPSTVIDLVPRQNGGMTLTHALVPGGLAIDRADPAACGGVDGDQRGAPNAQDGNGDGIVRCDIGALEHQPSLLTFPAVADAYVRTDLDVRRNDKHGLQDYLQIGSGRGGAGKPFGAPDQMRALLRFDIGALAGLRLTGAALEGSLQGFDGLGGPSLLMPRVHAAMKARGRPARQRP